MITVTVKFMGNLIKIAGSDQVDLQMQDGAVIRDLLEHIFARYGPEMRRQVMEEDGDKLAPYYKILVNGRNFKLIQEFETPLQTGQVIHIMPPIAGG